MNTPDTEMHMKALAKSERAKDAGEVTVVRLGYVVYLMKEVREERDTYWKERVAGMNVMHFCECKRQCLHTQKERDALLEKII